MSERNRETLRRLNQAFNRGDLDAGMRLLHPDAALYPGIQVPDEESRYVGREGIEQWFRNATEAWESITVELRELIELEDDRLLAIERWLFRGRQGIELESELANVFGFRDGLIIRIEGFLDKAAALEAVRS
jgi:ketosteroid isomerase-like protein